METEMQRLEALNDWAATSEMRSVMIHKRDLAWAVDRLRLLHEMIGSDMDLDGTLSESTYSGTGWEEEKE
jgi:hypothetical protein